MKTTITIMAVVVLSSCGLTSKLTDEQLEKRNKIAYILSIIKLITKTK